MSGLLQQELKKRNPFESREQEVYLNLLRTMDLLARDFDELMRREGISQTGYNVLRILRGVKLGAEGGSGALPCGEVGGRLVTREPDVTRLLDRLEKRSLIVRKRCEKDRRVVYAAITDGGMELLARLDEPTMALHKRQLSHMGEEGLSKLIELLEAARAGCGRGA